MPVMIMLLLQKRLLQKLPLMMMTITLIPLPQQFRLLTEVSTCNSAVLFSLGLCFWPSLVSSISAFLTPPRQPANLRKPGLQFYFKKPRSVAQSSVASDFC